jgi:phosphohistidine swiveling domain-containing protein
LRSGTVLGRRSGAFIPLQFRFKEGLRVSASTLPRCTPQSLKLSGKALRLRELQHAGFIVPRFVVSPDDLAETVASLGTPLVVRSSSSIEDGADVSFAGIFSSFLNLKSVEEVESAIRCCRQAADSAAVLEYCRRQGIAADSIQLEVIVQRMVQPELAGVAFSVNPLTGDERVVIEACEGLANRLLAGQQAALPPEHPLLNRYAPLIEQTVRAIQHYYGAPQDVEFAIEQGMLYVLQTRPITRITFEPEIGEWTNADFRDGGVSSDVCSPLMWSLYELAWAKAIQETLRGLKLWDGDFLSARLFFGRPYWNLGAVKRSVARLPGFVEREFDHDLSVPVTYEGNGACTPVTPLRVCRALRTVWAVKKFFRQQEQFDRSFLAHGFWELSRPYEAIGGDVEGAFGRLVQEDFLSTEYHYFRTIFAVSLAKLDLLTAFPQANNRSLLAGLAPLRHMDPVRAVRNLRARDERSLQTVITQFRHHYRQGLDIRFPRWDEDRSFVMRMLRDLPQTASTPSQDEFHSALACVQASIPWRRRRSFRRKLNRLRAFVWLREEMRDLSSRMYYLIRRFALQIAHRSGIGDDIFFMTFQQILADDRSAVEQQRETYESFRNFKAPNEIGSRYLAACPETLSTDGWQGLGVSAGVVCGPAFVARNVAEAAAMAAGQILVCPFTDPGWTPVLDRAIGVVAETGGLLSHAAVICREYGIPSVLAVEGATRRIRSGQWLRVDGQRGLVQIADPGLTRKG